MEYRHCSLLLWPFLLCYPCFKSIILCSSQGPDIPALSRLLWRPPAFSFPLEFWTKPSLSCGLYVTSKEHCSEQHKYLLAIKQPWWNKGSWENGDLLQGVLDQAFDILNLLYIVYSSNIFTANYQQQGLQRLLMIYRVITEIRHSSHHTHLGSTATLLLFKWLCRWFLLIIY